MSTQAAALNAPPPDLAVSRDRVLRIALFVGWCALTLWLASHHVFWRDEVRALSIALAGDDLPAMLRGLQGEGHPALWYLLLRGGYALTGMREVLPALAWIISAAAMAILVWRAPFRVGTIAIILFGFFGAFDYAVVARNYGISMLILFTITSLYSRHRDRGLLIGFLLALLCNTNVHANFLAAALLGFWLVELISEEGFRWTRKHWLWSANAAVAALGALLCFLMVYPPAHDAASASVANNTFASALQAVLSPAQSFDELVPPQLPAHPLVWAPMSLLLFGAVLGLLRRPAAFLAALGVLICLCLFFHLVYPGYHRHQALFLIFLVSLYWLAAEGRGGQWPERWPAAHLERAAGLGAIAFCGLLLLQVATSVAVIQLQISGVPYSRSRDLAELLRREELSEAILMADEDVMVEPMPYYGDNPLYLPRERRFGSVFAFDRHPRNHLTLDDLLGDARALRDRYRRPVVLLLRSRPNPNDPARHMKMLQTASFAVTPEQVARLQAETRLLASFGPALNDETYDVYLLDGPTD